MDACIWLRGRGEILITRWRNGDLNELRIECYSPQILVTILSQKNGLRVVVIVWTGVRPRSHIVISANGDS
jgi:hypothetical protein